MPYFRRPGRAPIVAFGLSLLLLADGLAVVPGHAAVAAEASPGSGASATDEVACAQGFSNVDSREDMSLHGVTLTPRGALAVGYTRRQEPGHVGIRVPATLVNHGRDWSRVFTGSPGDEDGLMAVASREGANTWAVGFTTLSGDVKPLAMRWDGKAWNTDRPKVGGSVAVFTDVTIVGDGSPFAVGYRMGESGKRKPLVIRKDGPRWRSVPMATGRRESLSLLGVGPDRRGGTWVVGHGGTGAEVKPVIYNRDDGKWQRYQLPRLKGEAILTDIVATNGSESWAVGYHRRDGRAKPLVLRWNGKQWKKVKAPSFASNDAMLSAVSADPAGGIWVVGAAWNDARKTHEAIAAWWDGHAWNEVAGRAGGTELFDAVGSLSGDGWAVGRADGSSRATRVCTPPQSGVFGSSETLPQADLTAGSEAAVALAATTAASGTTTTTATTNPENEASGAQEAAAGAKSRKKTRSKFKVVKVKTGTLPVATTDKRIVARNVAREAGVFEETGTYDAIVEDFDGDGVEDLFIGRHGRKGRLLLNRDGVFVDHQPLELDSSDRHGCTAADIDGSGLPDLYCAVGGKRGSGLKSNELILDPGGPAPVEVAVERGVSDATGRGRLSAFLEARKQKDTSLVVANSPTRVDGLPSLSRLWRTWGNGKFKARSQPGLAPRLGAQALQDADYDRDGREDLLLVTGGPQAPEPSSTRLYRNTRTGLVDVTRRMGIRSFDEVDAELVDINGDRRLDLVQLSPDQLRVSIQWKGKFRKVYQRKLTYGRAIAGGDINRDGKSDLYIVRSDHERNYPDVMLVNHKRGTRWSSLLIPQVSGGAGDDAYAIDHDGNGLDDFLVLNGHNLRGPTELIAFYRR